MRRPAVVGALLVLAFALPSQAYADGGDSAAGAGAIIEVSAPGEVVEIGSPVPATRTHSFAFSATSGPSGEGAAGTMSMARTDIAADGSASTQMVAAEVSCLAVSGTSAVVGGVVVESSAAELRRGDAIFFFVSDVATPGAGADRWVALSAAPDYLADCSPNVVALGQTLTTGDIAVADAPPDTRTPEQQLADLIAELQAADIAAPGSYLAKLETIAASIESSKRDAACGQLAGLASEVQAQSGKKLTAEDANALLRAIAGIQLNVGCRS
jgi:hypothetical protein